MIKSFFKESKKYFILFLFFIFFFTVQEIKASNLDVNLNVMGCNNNFICEAVIGEDELTCPNDCSAAPPPPPPPPTGGSTVIGSEGSQPGDPPPLPPIEINIREINTRDNFISVRWDSNIPVNASVSWGINSDDGSGFLTEIGFTTNHYFTLTNLNPDTNYFIKILVTDLHERQKEYFLNVQTKKTISLVDNVSDFNILDRNDKAILTWKNPNQDFDYIRIVKSENFFPINPTDGQIIYEGKGQSFSDSQIEKDKMYYYTIFVKTENGFSSGVIQNFISRTDSDFFGDSGEPIGIFGPIYDFREVTDLHSSELFKYIRFFQNGLEINNINNIFYVENDKEILILIEGFQNLYPNLQIFISYFDSLWMNKSRDYMFKYDEITGNFSVNFKIINSEESAPFIIYLKDGDLIHPLLGYFRADMSSLSDSKMSFIEKFLKNDTYFSMAVFFLIWVIIFWFFIIFFFKRRKKEEDEEDQENLLKRG